MSITLRDITPYLAKNQRGTVHLITMRSLSGEHEKSACGRMLATYETVTRDVDGYDGDMCGLCERKLNKTETE